MKKWPHLSFIVQDVSQILLSQGASKLASEYTARIKFQQHDFFTPQPLTDAAVFFMRQCLHNWPDEDCVKILRGFVPALEQCKDGTCLLINESILPSPGILPKLEERLLRQVDMSMLINLGSRQRTADDYRNLIKQADVRLQIVNVHSVGSMGLIEVQLSR